ncbi:unnamed protein product, partial [marine sediment metagenome]
MTVSTRSDTSPQLHYYRNAGFGQFVLEQEVDLDQIAVDIAVGDVFVDGRLDLIALHDEGLFSVVPRFAQPFSTPISFESAGTDEIVVGRFNGDDYLDLATVSRPSILGTGSLGIHLNGTLPADLTSLVGSFALESGVLASSTLFPSPVTEFDSTQIGGAPGAVAAGDFNGDGIQDAAIVGMDNGNDGENVVISYGDGSGNLVPRQVIPLVTDFRGGPTPFITAGDF